MYSRTVDGGHAPLCVGCHTPLNRKKEEDLFFVYKITNHMQWRMTFPTDSNRRPFRFGSGEECNGIATIVSGIGFTDLL